MTKETIYKKVQDLFPSSLGVGDVVEHRDYVRKDIVIVKIIDNAPIPVIGIYCGGEGMVVKVADLKCIRKAITLPMLLDKMNEINKKLSEWDKWHYSLFLFESYLGIDATKYRESDGKCIKLISIKWIFRKDGKDLHLYDQSIDLIKLVYEVLK